jgi:hypothetical protein
MSDWEPGCRSLLVARTAPASRRDAADLEHKIKQSENGGVINSASELTSASGKVRLVR